MFITILYSKMHSLKELEDLLGEHDFNTMILW